MCPRVTEGVHEETERDLLKEQEEIRVKDRQGSETWQVNLRGDPESASTQIKVEAGKSE